MESSDLDSFSQPLLDGPHYTRPANYENLDTPEVLLSGNHKEIDLWRKDHRLKRTKKNRPDLMEKNKKNKSE